MLFFLRTVLRALLESLNVIVFVLPAAIVSGSVASVLGFLARVRRRALPLHVVAAVQASLKLTLFFFSFSALLLKDTAALPPVPPPPAPPPAVQSKFMSTTWLT